METCPVCGQADNCGDCNHFPMPNSHLDGGIVVASVVYIDDERGEYATCVLLMPESPFYRVIQVRHDVEPREIVFRLAFENIVPTVDEYQQQGGDW